MAKKIKINCLNLINQTVSDKKTRAAFSQLIRDPDVRTEFGRRLVDRILERTADGLDKNENKFKKYKPSYVKSLSFEIYKSESDPVNLRLTGEMLDSLEARPKGNYDVELFFIGDFNNEKAEWAIDGTKHAPKRDFFGISLDEQLEALKNTLKDLENQGFDFQMANESASVSDVFSLDEEPEEG